MADNQTQLDIIIQAQDNASKSLQQIEQQLRSMSQSISGVGKASDDGQVSVDGLTGSFLKSGLALDAIHFAAGLAKKGILELLNLGEDAVRSAADYEQIRIAFETMLGSADKARVLLKQMSDFAAQTPFQLPQVVEGGKRLLAYGVEMKNIIPTFQTLGDIASGVGVEKMPQLTLAFGQVKAASHLTGMELRQFSEAGVPLLDALVKKANETGGAVVAMGGGAKKAKVDVADLNEKLAVAKQRLVEVAANTHAHKSSLMAAQNAVQSYQEKLTAAGSTQGAFTTKVQLTKAEMIKMISKGQVSFEQVQAALEGMTAKGGLFFNAMERQSKTFNGTISNLQDDFGRLGREIVGISESGDIRQGSLFAKLKDAAQGLLTYIDKNRAAIASFATKELDQLIKFVQTEAVPALQKFGEELGKYLSSPQFQKDLHNVTTELLQIAGALKTIADIGGAVGNVINRIHDFNTKDAKNTRNIIGNWWEHLGDGHHYASGTLGAPGGWSVVGEKGPELVNLSPGSQVMNAGQTRGALGQGASYTFNHYGDIRSDVDLRGAMREFGFMVTR